MSEPRPAPFLIGDDPALDFLNSVAAPWGTEIEWLASGEDLVAWLAQTRLLPENMATQFAARKSTRSLDAAALEARELREWFREFVRKHAGMPLKKGALRELAPLNQLLKGDAAYRQIAAAETGERGDEGRALRWQIDRRWRSPKAL